ncbi:MAG TPA: hypothetical protein PLK28_18850 [Candidatus Rifleibacterium sp.]|nr:hypothetical protein [Candidatus Rifleibacterium sp.]
MKAVMIMTIVLTMVSGSMLVAATVILSCDVGGSQLELYDDATRSWQKSSFPKVLNLPKYENL